MQGVNFQMRPGQFSRAVDNRRCRRVGSYHEELRELPNRQALVVTVCEACGAPTCSTASAPSTSRRDG
jgi:hypothetical protein